MFEVDGRFARRNAKIPNFFFKGSLAGAGEWWESETIARSFPSQEYRTLPTRRSCLFASKAGMVTQIPACVCVTLPVRHDKGPC